jgi:hypothetical protein
VPTAPGLNCSVCPLNSKRFSEASSMMPVEPVVFHSCCENAGSAVRTNNAAAMTTKLLFMVLSLRLRT